MSFTFGFYNSLAGDRKYNSVQISRLFEGIINDGVFASIGDSLMVTDGAGGMTVNVGTGRAWFNNTWNDNDAVMPITMDVSEAVLNRIDAIVLEVKDASDMRLNSIKKITGTPGSVPVAPEMINTTGHHQYPLAHIYVGAGVTEITAANITNKVGTVDCPFVTVVGLDALLPVWEDEFDVWFADLQAQMSGDVATNLQNQINDVSSRFNNLNASAIPIADNVAGLYGLPPEDANVDKVLQAVYPSYKKKKNIVLINSTQNWVCPVGVKTIDLFIIGGGFNGATSTSSGGGAGGDGSVGYTILDLPVVSGTNYSCVIGASNGGLSAFDGKEYPCPSQLRAPGGRGAMTFGKAFSGQPGDYLPYGAFGRGCFCILNSVLYGGAGGQGASGYSPSGGSSQFGTPGDAGLGSNGRGGNFNGVGHNGEIAGSGGGGGGFYDSDGKISGYQYYSGGIGGTGLIVIAYN